MSYGEGCIELINFYLANKFSGSNSNGIISRRGEWGGGVGVGGVVSLRGEFILGLFLLGTIWTTDIFLGGKSNQGPVFFFGGYIQLISKSFSMKRMWPWNAIHTKNKNCNTHCFGVLNECIQYIVVAYTISHVSFYVIIFIPHFAAI